METDNRQTGENGVIYFDYWLRKYRVRFKDGRCFYASDILKDWLDNNPKDQYLSPFDEKIK
jgi:hypothetical protein